MKYTQEENAKMELLVEAFQSYVNQRDDYDMIWSPKAGYLRLLTGENCDHIYFPITGFSDMLRMFTDDHLMDEEERAGLYLKQDYARVRSLLIPRLDTLGDYREEACEIMEQTFEAWRLADAVQPENLPDHLRTADL